MSNIKNKYLISVSALIMITCVQNTQAEDMDIPISLNNTHTPHTLELKPIHSDQDSYKLAAAKFLPEFAEGDFNLSGKEFAEESNYNRNECQDLSKLFTTRNCTYPKAIVQDSKCILHYGYYKRCECLASFSISSCPAPKFLSSPQCDGKAERCLCPTTVGLNYPNDRCTQTCDGNCTQKSCTPWGDESSCSYGYISGDNGCGGNRSVCKPCNLTPCSGISSKPSNSSYTISSCTDCGGTRTINSSWECNSGYVKSGTSCISAATEEERTAAMCKAEGYSYIWIGGSNGCGGHYQKYYRLPEWICPYNPNYGKNGCAVCSDIPDDSCRSSHAGTIDAGKGRTDLVWFGTKCNWAR